MVRFSNMLVVYFVLAAVMWGGGAIGWSDAGLGKYIINDPNDDDNRINNGALEDLREMGGPIGNVVGTLGGGLIVAWSILSNLIRFLFWPITVLGEHGAPPRVIILGGGSLTMAFLASVLRIVRGSA